MSENESQLKIRDLPLNIWIIGGGVAAAVGFYIYTKGSSPLLLLTGAAAILLPLFLTSILTITADKNTGILTLAYRSLLRRKVVEIPFDEIAAIAVQQKRDTEDNTRSHRIAIQKKNGEIVPLRSYYSGGYRKKAQQAGQLREFLGVGGTGSAFGGGLGTVIAAMQTDYRAEQESITGSLDEEHITNGVRWKLETLAFGNTPVTHWRSADFRWEDGFLYLAQKIPDAKDLSSNMLLCSFTKSAFEYSTKIYGFSARDLPGLARGQALDDLDPAFAVHFTAFTSDPVKARRILTPWTTTPLIEWAERHPFSTENTTDQLIVLFGPGGLTLAVMGLTNPEYLDELAELGAALVREQGR